MSSTSASSTLLLMIPARAAKLGINKSVLNFLFAIDSLKVDAVKTKLDKLLGVTLQYPHIKEAEYLGLTSRLNVGCKINRKYAYKLTTKGHSVLKEIINGTK